VTTRVIVPDRKAGLPYCEEVVIEDSPSVECFFCSGHLPCRDHKPEVFADLDLQEYMMGEITGEEFMERTKGWYNS
jgi:hypothetical protein